MKQDFIGLTEAEAQLLLQQYGPNKLHINDSRRLWHIVLEVIKEPMFLLLVAACVLYFLLGENTEGFMMVAALVFVSAISVFQELKSARALKALQQLTEPKVKVIRNATAKEIQIARLVPGDIMLVEEGEKIAADAQVLAQNDCWVNESILTGEAFPVEKTTGGSSNHIYQGTVLTSGRCTAKVTATGNNTELGKIGKSIITYVQSKTLLQQQIDVFVKRLATFGMVAFFLIFLVNYLHYQSWVTSLLFSLTLAMSAIPEEIPVAFSSFMALGAYHMSRLGIITRQPQTIENLGAINVICLDKTGTITENKMQVNAVYDFAAGAATPVAESRQDAVLFYALLASEEKPFDAMEKAIEEAWLQHNKLPALKMMAEYPLEGRPPMMTHVYEKDGAYLAAAKGALERILNICHLPAAVAQKITLQAQQMASKGHRVLGVASAICKYGNLPERQDDFQWQFQGLLSFYDPPKTFVKDLFRQFYTAGIKIKLLTGDYAQTAMTIAAETGLQTQQGYVTGEDINGLDDARLIKLVQEKDVFVRMFPEAKLRVIKALQAAGNIVAMTGDGVNDGPALKAANIGIALGGKGTEVARQAADLILTDDDLRKVAEAIMQGRKIFNNLKKAVRYIISIHIPIILTASVPLLLGWPVPNVFTPIHIIFLELIMGPTCSIFFEREPVEEHIMKMPPRKRESWLFAGSELLISVVQGFIITLAVLAVYYLYMQSHSDVRVVRTMVFTTLIFSNIFLTFVNRSFTETLVKTVRYKNNLSLPVILISITFLGIIHLVPFVRTLFGMVPVSVMQMLICLAAAFASVAWFELYKANLSGLNMRVRTDHKHAFH